MDKTLPTWALQQVTPGDRQLAADAQDRGTLQVAWPQETALRKWAGGHGWPAPRVRLQKTIVEHMLKTDENFSLALDDGGIRLFVPVAHAVLPDEELRAFDGWYAERGADGRPSAWGVLVEALREVRRAVEAGVTVEAAGHTLSDWSAFYTWAHDRYHMLEDGYDRWIGDDR